MEIWNALWISAPASGNNKKKICNLQKNICYENNKMCTFGLLYHS